MDSFVIRMRLKKELSFDNVVNLVAIVWSALAWVVLLFGRAARGRGRRELGCFDHGGGVMLLFDVDLERRGRGNDMLDVGHCENLFHLYVLFQNIFYVIQQISTYLNAQPIISRHTIYNT